jgi:23S rRNA (cytosine1962-C5)-methyltransferase
MSYPSLILKTGRERSAQHRHPWIFSGGVQHLPKSAENGAIVEVLDSQKNRLGYGFFSPDSQITCRLFEFTNEPLDVTTAEYWRGKVQRAYQLRQQYLLNTETNCYRLLHAEGDFFPGIITDVYGEVAVVQLLIKGLELIAPFVVEALQGLGIRYIYLKNKQNTGFLEQVTLSNGWLTPEGWTGKLTVKENKRPVVSD